MISIYLMEYLVPEVILTVHLLYNKLEELVEFIFSY